MLSEQRRAQVCGRRGSARVHGRLDQQRDEQGPARHAPVRVLLRRHHVRLKPGCPAERPAIVAPCACGSAGLSISWALGQGPRLSPAAHRRMARRAPQMFPVAARRRTAHCAVCHTHVVLGSPGHGHTASLAVGSVAGGQVRRLEPLRQQLHARVGPAGVTPGPPRGFQLHLASPCSLCLVGASTNRR
jgi:hypothetical protein